MIVRPNKNMVRNVVIAEMGIETPMIRIDDGDRKSRFLGILGQFFNMYGLDLVLFSLLPGKLKKTIIGRFLALESRNKIHILAFIIETEIMAVGVLVADNDP